MIMPSSIHIARGSDITPPEPPVDASAEPTPAPKEPVISRDAIVNKTDKMCATGKTCFPLPTSVLAATYVATMVGV